MVPFIAIGCIQIWIPYIMPPKWIPSLCSCITQNTQNACPKSFNKKIDVQKHVVMTQDCRRLRSSVFILATFFLLLRNPQKYYHGLDSFSDQFLFYNVQFIYSCASHNSWELSFFSECCTRTKIYVLDACDCWPPYRILW